MYKFKTLVALAVAAFSFATATAQNEEFEPHWFIGAKGGIQAVPTNYSFGKLITPAFGVNAGYQFVPQFGVRLDVQGITSKTAFVPSDATETFKYVTSDIDMIFNLTNMFSSTPKAFTVSAVAGMGYNFSWDARNAGKYPLAERGGYSEHLTMNSYVVRVGALCDYNLNRNWALQCEIDGNVLYDEFNSKFSTKEDWQLTAMVGVAYKFGKKAAKPAKPAPVVEEPVRPRETEKIEAATPAAVPATQPGAEKILPAIEYKQAQDIRIEIFFEKGEASIRPEEDAKLRGLGNYMRSHKVGTVVLSTYADKGTGTPAGNMKITEERAKTIAGELTKTYGIPADRITTKAYGDTVQPFAENDKNRVAIIEVKEAL